MSDLEKFEIPGHLRITPGNGGLPKLLIETGGSTAEIYLHGAHVTGFQKKGEPPLLFMSARSEFVAGAPIRGGVPVIFPWFGPREGFPSHGTARLSEWTILQTALLPDGSVRVDLALAGADDFEVGFVVTAGDSLGMELTVKNTGDAGRSFANCLHTYFQVGDIHKVSISGLQGTGYTDSLTARSEVEAGPSILIDREVDRIYQDTTATVDIHDPSLGRTIHVAKSGSNSTVVWNPWIDKSIRMPDFGDEEYLQMLCVESGNIAKNQITLAPSASSTLKVEISSSAL
ncbi:D-hexose-6-phosphate mutarotase [Luteolibacter yonseiensis]|uniref:Putative glucose-6-phosphate 1-epimerase n=1 Tax=Luteolibacter yonseiensis TaxID=1144680 RepID=A0A934R3W4_9BACT|nr:D-hexose-6-phosphate mutarotase [Luteolibacter yonseiensis]MBK1814810.1 D-hexose-6-phosphate mutarotase [Luteolibacter yonseiensis]